MRYILELLFIIWLYCSSCTEYLPDSYLIGKWENIENDGVVELIFSVENKFEMKIKPVSNDNIFSYKGDYIIDKNKIPNTIDLKNISNYPGPLYGILEIIDLTTIKISKFSDKWRLRPILFNKNNSLLFNRKTIQGNS